MTIKEVSSSEIFLSMRVMMMFGQLLKNVVKSKVRRFFCKWTISRIEWIWSDVRLIRDAGTSVGKGFGYVLFQVNSFFNHRSHCSSSSLQDEASVALALRMNGNCRVGNREIRIKPAVKKPKVNLTNDFMIIIEFFRWLFSQLKRLFIEKMFENVLKESNLEKFAVRMRPMGSKKVEWENDQQLNYEKKSKRRKRKVQRLKPIIHAKMSFNWSEKVDCFMFSERKTTINKNQLFSCWISSLMWNDEQTIEQICCCIFLYRIYSR